MLNWIWAGLVVVAVLVGAVNGRLDAVTKAAFEGASSAVHIALGLVGVLALWLGIVKIGERAGLVELLARTIHPLARRLFPDVPPNHPALGAIVMNLAASWLGLGNAATPLGLKAMAELATLNPHVGVATDAMVMFLALNTSCITLVPATILGVRVALGSTNPAAVVGPTIFASTTATLVAIVGTRLLGQLPAFRLPLPHNAEKE